MEKLDLAHGELTRIIIGTVVASEKGLNARALAEKLNAQGIAVTKQQMSVRLAELAAEGRIERVERGRFEGV
jgi:hypothetical protein